MSGDTITTNRDLNAETKVDSRCTCGSRWFLRLPIMITCLNGKCFELGAAAVFECIPCSTRWVFPTYQGPKRLLPFDSDALKQMVKADSFHKHIIANPGDEEL